MKKELGETVAIPKIISMYLPQFHRVKENDEWWGEGFTEWTAVKQADSLFDGHYQPRIPLNGNYYDLLDKETMQWQADLMKKYGIDGQCIYHYWFKEGRQILEKPAQNLLKWTDIDMPFCFCWANESWARTWSGLKNTNAWSAKQEPKKQGDHNGLLLEQYYGTEEDWRKHFDYLLDFFKDGRYIKIENKPVFMIYKVSDIYCLRKMIDVWRKLAVEAGFSGIYLIGANVVYSSDAIDMVLLSEPDHALQTLRALDKKQNGPFRYNYTDVWNEILRYSTEEERISIQGLVDRDDTPRNGQNGWVVENTNPELFRKYLSELIAKNISNGCDITFINAWNEWGEGMYLEPDKKNKYAFLEGVVYARKHYVDYLEKYRTVSRVQDNKDKKEAKEYKELSRRYRSYWVILNDWLTLKELGVELKDYFLERGVHSVAIYGIGLLGKHLYFELKDSEIEIKGIIDRETGFNRKRIALYQPEEDLPEVDMIIVTVTYAYHEISGQLKKRGIRNVISLEEIIQTVLSDKGCC